MNNLPSLSLVRAQFQIPLDLPKLGLMLGLFCLWTSPTLAQTNPGKSVNPTEISQAEVGQAEVNQTEEEQQRQACERAIAAIAEAEAAGEIPEALEPICQQYQEEQREEQRLEAELEPETETGGADIVITVTGTRTERPLLDSAAAITVIDRERIDREQAQEIDDLVRYEPGIAVGNNLQFGLQGFTIRGIGGNRVLNQVDGIRLPTAFQFGDNVTIAQGFNIGRDYFETESLQRLEIINGPASALYGSDALGGVVSYLTLDPGTLLDAVGQNTYTEISPGFSFDTEGFTSNIIQAARGGGAEVLLSFTRRDGFGSNTVEDNLASTRNAFLGKLVYNFDDVSSLDLTGELFDNRVDYTTASENLPLISSSTSFYTEEIETRRSRISLAYTYDNEDDVDGDKFLNYARARFYWQDAETTEDNVRDLLGVTFGRFGPSFFPAQRVSANRFIEEVYGGDLIFRNDFATPNASHRLTYGVDLSTTFNSRPRQRVQTNLTTGASTTNAIPDDFPLKDFPDTNTLRLGLYIQDEVEFGHDRWALIPGIRFDHYDLNAQSDQDFERNGAEAADFSGSSLSPSLGVLYRLTDQVNLFGRYSRGFRAPLYSEINNGFSNQIFGYTTLPNPDLEAETSNSFELGVRGETRRFDFSLVGFYNNYDNFIDFQQVGTTPVNGRSFLLFQTRNVDEARTYGLEAKGEYQFSTGPGGFSLLGSLGWTVGDDLTSDEPLASVDPFEAVLGLRYQDPNDRWGTELLTTVVGQARGNSLDGNQGFVPDPYAVVDLLGYVNVTSDLSLNVGVYNLFNTEYFRYQDVRFLDTEEAFFNQRRDRRARPGTNFRIGVTMRL